MWVRDASRAKGPDMRKAAFLGFAGWKPTTVIGFGLAGSNAATVTGFGLRLAVVTESGRKSGLIWRQLQGLAPDLSD